METIGVSKKLAKALKDSIPFKEGEEVSIGYSPKEGTFLVAIEDTKKEPTIVDLVYYIDPKTLEVLDYSRVGELEDSSPKEIELDLLEEEDNREKGQGLIEYAIILLLVGIVVAILLGVLGRAAPELGEALPSLLGL